MLFLSFSLNSSGAEVEYKVLSKRGALARRADVFFNCPVKSAPDYTLSVERVDGGVLIELSFSSSELHLKQPLKEGEKLSKSARLFEVERGGEVKELAQVPFKGRELKVENLNPQKRYLLRYLVELPPGDDSVPAPEIEEEKGVEFRVSVFFPKGSYRLNKEAKFLLDGVKPLTKSCKVKIVGYADSTKIVRAKVESNEALAKKRALSVLNYLGVNDEDRESNNKRGSNGE